MSVLLVEDYQRRLSDLLVYGGSANEENIRKAFARLLDDCARPHDLRLIEELEYITPKHSKVYPDGTLKDALRLPHGYWEAKDEFDDLDEEIRIKLMRGYPTDNIVFEDSRLAVLIQNGDEVGRVNLRGDPEAVATLLDAFVRFERPEIADFRRAIEQFSKDLPKVLQALRTVVTREQSTNKKFSDASKAFLKLCQESINKNVTEEDIREMLLQHILTEDIFLRIFGDSQFHRENNIARELQKVSDTFFTGSVKRNLLRGLESYYGAIRDAAAGIADHHEKQKFLKAIYENFYKVYNPNLADRLGVVYTPSEIVRFMLDSLDALLHRAFNKTLASKQVEILDPAVGTGTFITDLIEHLKTHPSTLDYKYTEEIHCNEVAILPYYIANLNIEFTYAHLAGQYKEFPHICFVDTLDNLGFEKTHTGQQLALLGGMSEENVDRIAKQNKRKISVVLGNPPYNANQQNDNDNNRNRSYDGVDQRIRDTWVAASRAQKTKLYDMYARFFRWAADRVNSDGIVAFITNRSFIDSRTFDGFRLEMAKEFSEVYIIDLGGDVRANPKLSGTVHNVFGIQTGVAISFWVKQRWTKRGSKPKARIFYTARPAMETAADKLSWLSSTRFNDVAFEPITPDDSGNWLNVEENDFQELIPIANRETKGAASAAKERAIFKLYSLGPSSNRDDWAYDFDKKVLGKKISEFCAKYASEQRRWQSSGRPRDIAKFVSRDIKWTAELERHLVRGTELVFEPKLVRQALYRPFVKKWTYFAPVFTHRTYQQEHIFPFKGSSENPQINVYSLSSTWPLATMASLTLGDLNQLKQGNGGTFTFPLYRYDNQGNRAVNVTDWALKLFKRQYAKETITHERIFWYVYGVLHNPTYRRKYAINLKRELPRIPLYRDFPRWSDWGKELLDLHANFDRATLYPLVRDDGGNSKNRVQLKARKEDGKIIVDSVTTLSGVPSQAWEYKLGNRTAIEWVLDQYRDGEPRDPTIRSRFNTYRFSDHKEEVIALLCRVTSVSLRTQQIVALMEVEEPSG